MSLSAVILTQNEERHLRDCLAGLTWADELLVLDSGSVDRTPVIATEMGARVEQRPFDNYPRQRNAALQLAGSEWILFVDADERVPSELAAEIRAATESQEAAGFWIPRRNYIVGRWVRHAGWYPDYQPRLLQRGRARWDERREVHEVVLFEGRQGYLNTPLIHYNYDSWREFVERQSRYTAMEVAYLQREGNPVEARQVLTQPLREFWRRYVTLAGYLDGGHGLLLSLLMSYFEGVKYAQLWRSG